MHSEYEDLIEHLAQAAFTEWRKQGENLPAWEGMPEEAKIYFRGIATAVFSRLSDYFFAHLSPSQLYDLLCEIQSEEKKGGKDDD